MQVFTSLGNTCKHLMGSKMFGCLQNKLKLNKTIVHHHSLTSLSACGFFKLINPFELEIVSQAGLSVWTCLDFGHREESRVVISQWIICEHLVVVKKSNTIKASVPNEKSSILVCCMRCNKTTLYGTLYR